MSILFRHAKVLPPFMFMAHDPQIPEEKKKVAVLTWISFFFEHEWVFLHTQWASYLTLTTGAPKCEGWIYLVLDFNEGIQNHWTTPILERRKRNSHL